MNDLKCPSCGRDACLRIAPFCSAGCLDADPRDSQDPDVIRRLEHFEERSTGGGAPGGRVSVNVDNRLGWYLAGAQDEQASFASRDDGITVAELLVTALAQAPDDSRWAKVVGLLKAMQRPSLDPQAADAGFVTGTGLPGLPMQPVDGLAQPGSGRPPRRTRVVGSPEEAMNAPPWVYAETSYEADRLKDAVWLREQYEVNLRPSHAIAGELGCTTTKLHRALRHHGIPKRSYEVERELRRQCRIKRTERRDGLEKARGLGWNVEGVQDNRHEHDPNPDPTNDGMNPECVCPICGGIPRVPGSTCGRPACRTEWDES